MRLERGIITDKSEAIGAALTSGTAITLRPDAHIFSAHFNADRLVSLCRQLAYLHPDVRFLVHDQERGRHISIHYPTGLAAYALDLAGREELPLFSAQLGFFTDRSRVEMPGISVALTFAGNAQLQLRSFLSYMPTPSGGSHVFGFKCALSQAFRSISAPRSRHRNFWRGAVAVIHGWHKEMVWLGCTKSKAAAPGLAEWIVQELKAPLAVWLESTVNRSVPAAATSTVTSMSSGVMA